MDDFKIKRITIMFMKGLRLADIPSTDDMFNRRVLDEEQATVARPDIKYDITYNNANYGTHDVSVVNKKDNNAAANNAVANYSILNTQIDTQKYLSLPKEFNSGIQWPKTTNCKCWYCDLNFSTVPVFIPTNFYINKSGDEEFTVEGNFCTFNCAQKYINLTYLGRSSHHETYTRLLRKLYYIFNNCYIKKIIESPDKTIMKQYCGDRGITPLEYRKKIHDLNELYKNIS